MIENLELDSLFLRMEVILKSKSFQFLCLLVWNSLLMAEFK